MIKRANGKIIFNISDYPAVISEQMNAVEMSAVRITRWFLRLDEATRQQMQKGYDRAIEGLQSARADLAYHLSEAYALAAGYLQEQARIIGEQEG